MISNNESRLKGNEEDRVSEQDKKFSDAGRDGDYTKASNSAVEEGNEDYDDEQEKNKEALKKEPKDEGNSYMSYGGNSNENAPDR